MFRNKMPRYEILSEDAMAKLDAGGVAWSARSASSSTASGR